MESPLGPCGGGWQIWEGKPFVPEYVRSVMMERTNRGGLLSEPLEVPPAPDSEKPVVRAPDW